MNCVLQHNIHAYHMTIWKFITSQWLIQIQWLQIDSRHWLCERLSSYHVQNDSDNLLLHWVPVIFIWSNAAETWSWPLPSPRHVHYFVLNAPSILHIQYSAEESVLITVTAVIITKFVSRSWMVNYTFLRLYPRRNNPRFPLDGRLAGPQNRCACSNLPLPGIEEWTLSRIYRTRNIFILLLPP